MAALTASNAHAQGHYANVNGLRMYYEIHGTGRPLVLIHGGGSTIESSFATLIPLLRGTHKLIAVELQAHGRTSDRNAPESFEQDADDVAALLEQLEIPRADILGFSNGGSTALQLGIRHPARVNRLVAIAAIHSRAGMPAGFWAAMQKATFSDMPQALKDAFLRVNPDTAKLRVMFNRDRTRMTTFKDWKAGALKTIAAPTLVVVGDEDVVRVEHAVEMTRLLPHARLAVLPGIHGEVIGEATTPKRGGRIPALFAAIVDDFLSAPPSPN